MWRENDSRLRYDRTRDSLTVIVMDKIAFKAEEFLKADET